MKKFIWIIILILLVGTGFYILNQRKNKVESPTQLPITEEVEQKTFVSADQSITFKYPENLSVSQKNNIITIHHDIPYKNMGACDMAPEEKVQDNLTDFHMTIKLYNLTVASTSKIVSPSIPQENISGDLLKITPGFIDSYTNGTWNGYALYEGAEGCGNMTYYLPISSSRTLVIQQNMIQALSNVRGVSEREKILAVPGVISQEDSQVLFNDILKSLTVR